MTHGLGAEPATTDGTGDGTHVTVRDRHRSTRPVARRCSFCDTLVEGGSSHWTAIVEVARADGEPRTLASMFCEADCLDEWVRTMGNR